MPDYGFLFWFWVLGSLLTAGDPLSCLLLQIVCGWFWAFFKVIDSGQVNLDN